MRRQPGCVLSDVSGLAGAAEGRRTETRLVVRGGGFC